MTHSRLDIPLAAAMLTPRGRGAVATIQITGDRLSVPGDLSITARLPFRAASGKPIHQKTFNQVVFGRWGSDPGEEVVLCRTATDRIEIHCHGGISAVDQILDDLKALGISVIPWDDQVLQQCGLFEQYFELCLSKATTFRTATWILAQKSAWIESLGLWRVWVENQQTAKVQASIETILTWSDFGRHLTEPYRVVLTGRPNVGKSSLINALVGFQRSIVFDQPGTTRDVVTSETVWDGWPILLADTAGLRRDASGLEASGIELANEQIAHADLVLVVWDASGSEDQFQDHYLNQSIAGKTAKTLAVANKIDLRPDSTLGNRPEIDFLISAQTGHGLDNLVEEACRMLVPQLPPRSQPVPFWPGLVGWLHGYADVLRTGSQQQQMDTLQLLLPDVAAPTSLT